ncbi:hypothetical protein JX266_007399 [Neoarthrinium moseri]|nr:hypothetical protein JX266_007399 [Neoarthrinium moseri]
MPNPGRNWVGAAGMERVRHPRMHLGEEPVYCAAYDDNEEVLYPGADQELDQAARVAKRLRYEEQGLRYLRGQPLRLLSASLQGPFDRASGWHSPWLPKAPKATDTAAALPLPFTKTIPPIDPIMRQELAEPVAQEHDTPTTRDSLRCHLPSPDSQRELELAVGNPLDVEKRSRIREWATNVAPGFQRDAFWVPEDRGTDPSEEDLPAKRPAGEQWLRRKLNKRRKTDMAASFPSGSTPTPAPMFRQVTKPVSVHARDKLRASSAGIHRSFADTTPSSGSDRRATGLLEKRTSSARIGENMPSQTGTLSKGKVAVKASAFGRSTGKKHVAAPASLASTEDSEQQGATPGQANSQSAPVAVPLALDRNVEKAPTIAEVSKEQRPARLDIARVQVSEQELATSFESQVDQSFHYKTRPARLGNSTSKAPSDDKTTNTSQLTQTATPESEDHCAMVAAQLGQTADAVQDDTDIVDYYVDDAPANLPSNQCAHGCEEDQPVSTRSDEVEQDTDEEVRHERDAGGEQAKPQETVQRHEPDNHVTTEASPPATADQLMISFPEDVTLVEKSMQANRLDANAGINGNPVKDACDLQDQGEVSDRPLIQDQAFQGTVFDEGPTLVENSMDMDASTLSRMDQVPARLETLKFPSQPPERFEAVKYPVFLSDGHEANIIPTEVEREDLAEPSSSGASLAEIAEQAFSLAVSNSQSTSAEPDEAQHQDAQADQEDETAARTDITNVDHLSDTEKPAVRKPLLLVRKSKPTIIVEELSEEGSEEKPQTTTIQAERAPSNDESGSRVYNSLEPQSPWAPDHPPRCNNRATEGLKVEPVEEETWSPCPRPISVADSPGLGVEQPELRSSQQSPWTNDISEPMENVAELSRALQSIEAPSTIQQLSYRRSSSRGDANEQREPSTPSQPEARAPTPDADLSIKSFAKFNTPSPKRKHRITKHSRYSSGRLPSTQSLADATNINPWSSVRSSIRSSARSSRRSLRVSFAPLPGEETEEVAEGIQPINSLAATARVASPPPPPSALAGDEDVDDHFQSHFNTMKRRLSEAPKLRLQPRLLPSESQQKPMSPGVGLMAEAFREADLRQALRSSPEIAVDDDMEDVENEVDLAAQSPWRGESQGIDDVAAVLQNLDDFLNPRWDVETEVEKVRAADGIENQPHQRSSGLFGGSVWDIF